MKRKRRDEENEMLNSYKATAMPKKPLSDVKTDKLRTFEEQMHSSCFQRSPQLSTEISQPPSSCQPSSEALALPFQGKYIIYQPCLGWHQARCRDQQILTEHCRESWLTISTQSPLLQGLSVPCPQAQRTEVSVLQSDMAQDVSLWIFHGPSAPPPATLHWPEWTSGPRRDFGLYCYPPSHPNLFPIIALHYVVSVVQISPGDITGIADIIQPLLGQLQHCTVFRWGRKWVRHVVLLFWVCCKAQASPHGMEAESLSLR